MGRENLTNYKSQYLEKNMVVSFLDFLFDIYILDWVMEKLKTHKHGQEQTGKKKNLTKNKRTRKGERQENFRT